MAKLHSRCHRLNAFPTERCFVKRDDELSAGVSGTKYRKYLSLIPFLKKHHYQQVIVIAGAQSNNLLAACQLLREHQFFIHAFILKPWTAPTAGNFKLSQLFLDEADITWIDRDCWCQVEQLATAHAKAQPQKTFVLNEGASVLPAFAGAKGLAADIVVNEKALGVQFETIFIDSGTGFSACALIAGLSELNHPAKVSVLLLADDEAVFKQKLLLWSGLHHGNYQCFLPTTAKSFGSINQTVRKGIKQMAREEGILVDPIYSAKLFMSAREKIATDKPSGHQLIIHSGGVLSLALL